MIRPLWIAVFLIICYLIVGTIDYAAARVSEAIRLENSSAPATMDEGERARPALGRPAGCVSHQYRTAEPWMRRTCWWT